MLNQISTIAQFIVAAFIHIWPYLVVTIPLAVAVNMSGASKYINRAFQARPIVAIILATAVGAFSPFCSCGVIPVIAALLMGGVPLAPVMSFWIASPSMDPEIFFLSVSTIGWNLAVWRLASTLVLSLVAGFLTHFIMGRGWLGRQTLRQRRTVAAMDVLVPRIGEIIGGSQREERLDVLTERMREAGMNVDDYWWYADLRRYGTVPHAGFGLGLERCVQFCTGMANIRDVIPYPRTPRNAEF